MLIGYSQRHGRKLKANRATRLRISNGIACKGGATPRSERLYIRGGIHATFPNLVVPSIEKATSGYGSGVGAAFIGMLAAVLMRTRKAGRGR